MKTDTARLLVEPHEIHDFVDSLWSDGPIRRAHREGGWVRKLVDRFARVPRIFFEPSDVEHEWTHFSPWWGAILLCEYDNPAIRDLRYLHEIHHAATLPPMRGLSDAAMAARNFQNERETSTYTEIAIYLELPDLRPITFPHAIFADRILFDGGDLSRPRADLLRRWREEPDLLFQELMWERTRVVLADDSDVDPADPQTTWLRRYPEQGQLWCDAWNRRHRLVDDAMVSLRDSSAAGRRREAGERHLEWLLSDEIAEGTSVPFVREARAFRSSFDALIRDYDAMMDASGETAVKHTTRLS